MLFENGQPHDFRYLEVNPAFERQTGLEHAAGKTASELMPSFEQPWLEFYGGVALTGEPVRFENRAEELNRWFDVYAFRFGRRHSRKVAVLFTDISERKRSQEDVEELNRSLEKKVLERTAELAAVNTELESFSYSVSHDLRAPLRAIDGFSQALTEDCAGQLDEAGKTHLQRIRAAAGRMADLIDALLSLGRLARAELRRQQVDLSALAQSIADELRGREPQREAEFVIENGLHVLGDARLLRAVMENLLGNAWKFTAKRPRARIEFGARQENGDTVYFVRDDGAGFNMAYAGKLFGTFQRLHGMTEFAGNGIGLATVQRIIHQHGGRVWAEGAELQGATFYFTVGPTEAS
jgi:light-regulated signal transduction histidine kinase (bacteriophytochrome)